MSTGCTARRLWEAIEIDTLEQLDKLEDLIENSKHLLNNAFVNIDEFYTITNKLRASLPEDIKTATKITKEVDQVLADARNQGTSIVSQSKAEAEKIVQEGRVQVENMVAENEITRIATERAQEIISGADDEARRIKSGADDYAAEVLGDLESFVGKVAKTIQLGKDKLEQKSAENQR